MIEVIEEEKDYYILMALVIGCLLILAIGVRNSTMNTAVENCITANQDWTVATATTYCNSVVREGKRP